MTFGPVNMNQVLIHFSSMNAVLFLAALGIVNFKPSNSESKIPDSKNHFLFNLLLLFQLVLEPFTVLERQTAFYRQPHVVTGAPFLV